MKGNARQGFWNGAKPPFGYKTVEVERRGSRVKKRLEIDEVEAEQVRFIFNLVQAGMTGQVGLKQIANWLASTATGPARTDCGELARYITW